MYCIEQDYRWKSQLHEMTVNKLQSFIHNPYHKRYWMHKLQYRVSVSSADLAVVSTKTN